MTTIEARPRDAETQTPLTLSLAVSRNPMTRALLNGEVQAENIRLIPSSMHGSEMFWRQLRYAEFDVSDMSTSSLTISYSKGVRDWVAIPVFTARHFFHTYALVRNDRGINVPADLKGKRVGVPEYQQTAAIWTRGILQHEFGVNPKEIEWFMERGADKSHGGATGFIAPKGVTVHPIPPTTNIGEMLVSGELDATVLYLTDPNLVDRSRIDLAQHKIIRPLFPDKDAEIHRYYAKTGIYPINHTMVIRRSIYEKHPWVARAIYDAFAASAKRAQDQALTYLAPYRETGEISQAEWDVFSKPVMPYGLKAARHVIESITGFVYEQGLCERKVALEEFYAPETLDL